MATATSTTTAPTAKDLAQQILEHRAPSYTFTFSPFLRKTYGHGLAPNRPGESCEFLHEYNLRKMPECNFFVRNGYCSNGDECLYLHIDPQSKLPPCPHYDMGFCPLGPNCSKKHVRRSLCPYYLAGFCPDGKQCPEGAHPRWSKNLERPVPKSEKAAEDEAARREREEQAFAAGGDDDGSGFRRGGDRDDKDGGGRGGFRGRGRGGWKPRGRGFGRGRGHH
ncbi:RNA-binding component of cleavage and polyadenylation factor [Neopestalotiopsis sp. 37M]|nr:RNA-binding component of cleavage and polyadenylation factor [Neopestalotiopsis sp. 37M]